MATASMATPQDWSADSKKDGRQQYTAKEGTTAQQDDGESATRGQPMRQAQACLLHTLKSRRLRLQWHACEIVTHTLSAAAAMYVEL